MGDPELEAAQAIVDALEPLELVQRERILNWARDRYLKVGLIGALTQLAERNVKLEQQAKVLERARARAEVPGDPGPEARP